MAKLMRSSRNELNCTRHYKDWSSKWVWHKHVGWDKKLILSFAWPYVLCMYKMMQQGSSLIPRPRWAGPGNEASREGLEMKLISMMDWEDTRPNKTRVSRPPPALSGVYRTIWPLRSLLFQIPDNYLQCHPLVHQCPTYTTSTQYSSTNIARFSGMLIVWMCSTAPGWGHSDVVN